MDQGIDVFEFNYIKYLDTISDHLNIVKSVKKQQINELSNNVSINKLHKYFKNSYISLAEEEMYRAFIYGQIIAKLEKNEPILKFNNSNAIIYRELAETLFSEDSDN